MCHKAWYQLNYQLCLKLTKCIHMYLLQQILYLDKKNLQLQLNEKKKNLLSKLLTPPQHTHTSQRQQHVGVTQHVCVGAAVVQQP